MKSFNKSMMQGAARQKRVKLVQTALQVTLAEVGVDAEISVRGPELAHLKASPAGTSQSYCVAVADDDFAEL